MTDLTPSAEAVGMTLATFRAMLADPSPVGYGEQVTTQEDP